MNEFVKGQGLGNDYILVHMDSLSFPLDRKAISLICDRHFGVGGDGILALGSSNSADFEMRVFNPDGSEAEMCGNGARIFAKYLYEAGLVDRKQFKIETLAGIIEPEVELEGKRVNKVKVMMGKANFDSSVIPLNGPKREAVDEELGLDGETMRFTAVSMGNPHCVVFVEDVDRFDVKRYGSSIEKHALFPNRTNVQFVTPISRKSLKAKIWERGVGETLASGTSASAVAAVSVKRDISDRSLEIILPGGKLDIEVDEDFTIHMTGPAVEVFRGKLSDEVVEMIEHD